MIGQDHWHLVFSFDISLLLTGLSHSIEHLLIFRSTWHNVLRGHAVHTSFRDLYSITQTDGQIRAMVYSKFEPTTGMLQSRPSWPL